MKLSFNTKIILLVSFLGILITALFLQPPYPQDIGYHNFADQKFRFGIPNLGNVWTNVFFVIAGVYGWYNLKKETNLLNLWRFFYFSIILVGLGSGYYHLNPNNETLVLDRLPMTFGFASLISILITNRINEKVGKLSFVPLLLAGAGSVFYWIFTEHIGAGDLRPYIIMQFLPICGIPLLLALFPHGLQKDKPLLLLLFWYVVAKICEVNDLSIFQLTHNLISGHSLKHFFAAIAIFCFKPLENFVNDNKLK